MTLKKQKLIKVNHNNLESLPENIDKLEKLEKLQINHNNLTELPNSICSLKLDREIVHRFIAGNNFICGETPECIDEFLGFNYEYNTQGSLIYEPQNCSDCADGFKGIIKRPENIFVTDDNHCYNKSDLYALQEIINVNSTLTGFEPLEIGNQTWEGGQIVSLALIDAGLEVLPEVIAELDKLEILHLDRNSIQYLPQSIGNLKNLQELVLDENQISALPESIGNINNLRGLSMDNNQLSTLPESFGNLKNLEELYLNYNNIMSLPDSFGNLENLEILLIYYNQLISLPKTIGQLNNLQVLYSSNNKIRSLPETISNLHSLKKLWISSNQLTTLPLSLCELPADCDINVSYNCLSKEYHYRCISDAGHHLGYWCK